MKFTGVMILGVVLLVSSAVYTECVHTEVKRSKSFFTPGYAAECIGRQIFKDFQRGFLYLRNHDDELPININQQYVKDTKENNMWLVPDMDLRIAEPTEVIDTSNFNHAEHKLLSHLTAMGTAFMNSHNKCPESVILGTVLYPCNKAKNVGCGVDYVNQKNIFKTKCPDTKFSVYISGPNTDEFFESIWYKHTKPLMEDNQITIYHKGDKLVPRDATACKPTL